MSALSSSRQISSLYCHQAEAINALAEGSHVIGEIVLPWYFAPGSQTVKVSTPTASGKSIIYQVGKLSSLSWKLQPFAGPYA